MAEELGWDQEAFDEAFQEAFQQGMVKADFKARLVWLPNAIKHNKPESPNVVRSCNAARPVAGAALDDDLAIDGYTTESLAVKLGIDASNSEITDREEGKGREGKGKEGIHDASDDASPKPRTQSASRFAEFWQAWPAGPRKQSGIFFSPIVF